MYSKLSATCISIIQFLMRLGKTAFSSINADGIQEKKLPMSGCTKPSTSTHSVRVEKKLPQNFKSLHTEWEIKSTANRSQQRPRNRVQWKPINESPSKSVPEELKRHTTQLILLAGTSKKYPSHHRRHHRTLDKFAPDIREEAVWGRRNLKGKQRTVKSVDSGKILKCRLEWLKNLIFQGQGSGFGVGVGFCSTTLLLKVRKLELESTFQNP